MRPRDSLCLALLTACLAALSLPTCVIGQDSATPAPAAISHFDPVAATNAYLATVPPDKRARSDAYFEGGYWLQLWDFLLGAGVALILLAGRFSARMRDLAERLTRRKPLQTLAYWIQYLLVITIVLFPMTVYEGFFREHKYGLATQNFGSWMGDQLKGILVGLVLGGIIVAVLYGVVRKLQRTWWLWGAVVSIVFLALVQLIAPIYISPLFNKYTRLTDPAVRDPILRLAHSNGIEADDVYVMDASRQTTRISANVSGFLGTERITLNDNLLNRCSLGEVETVMAHEIGHAVLHHVYGGLFFFSVILAIGFAYLRWAFDWVVKRKGTAWGIRGIGDVAGLPLVVLLFSIFFFVLTPIINTYVRTIEAEADLFALNAARQPDAEALVDLKLGEYRKLDPGPIEEFLFFDHPSGRSRIFMAMRWKAFNKAAAAQAGAPATSQNQRMQ
ncbi:MAG: M48 family metallopeptidase [Acidobacteriota bacterium]